MAPPHASTGRTSAAGPSSGFVEVGDRVWVARHEWYDVNVSVVGGSDGFVVVDTHASAAAAQAIVDDLGALFGVGHRNRLLAIVNTHAHFDHVFGNDLIHRVCGPAPIYAHEGAAADIVTWGERLQQHCRAQAQAGQPEPRGEEFLATTLRGADRTFSSVAVLDLGDRAVELVHPGRGHTGGDAIVHIPDADVLLAGDLIEESAARSAVPGFGTDCFPLEWPATLELVIGLTTGRTTLVPGHGAPVDRSFAEAQQGDLAIVAETIAQLARSGVPVEEALAAAEWPYPTEELSQAVVRGYAQLLPEGRQLPLA
ncbi:MAG: MBL fold metallo-hydrolase [Nocardioides sp.]